MNKFSLSINYGFFLSADDRFRLVKEAGFDNVGLWWGKESEWFNLDREEQFDLAKKYGLNVDYVHAPFNYHFHLKDDRDEVYFEGIKEHKRWIDGLSDKGVEKMVIHLNRLTKDEYVTERLLAALEGINAYAKDKGVKIAVENIGRPDDLEKVFSRIKDIYFCFDSSHASLEGDTTGKYLEKYADRLIVTHFSDNDKIGDRHWVLGKGIIDFDNMANILLKKGYQGNINMEVVEDGYPSAETFLKELRERAEKYFGKLDVCK